MGTSTESLPGERPSSRQTRWRRLTWVGVLAAATIRFLQPLHFYPSPAERVAVHGEMARIGYHLYKQGDWADPFSQGRTGPTAHTGPVYPAIIAGLYYLFGSGAVGVYSAELADSITLIAQVALLPLVAKALGADAGASLLAASLAVLGLARCPLWEANFLGLLLLVCTLLACGFLSAVRPRGDGRLPPTRPVLCACAAGLTWGTVLLTGPAAISVWLAWLLFGGWYSYHARSLRAFLPALVVPVVVISPWLLRNYRVLHSPVLRSNLGIMLSMSNNPCAGFGDRANAQSPCVHLLNPNENPEETQKVRDLGEIEYNRLKFQEAEQWIRSNPRSFWRLMRERFLYFWFPALSGSFGDAPLLRGTNPVRAWVLYGTTLLSVPGLFLLWSTSRYGCTICATFLLFYPLVYYVVQFGDRYRFPITWVTLLLAAVTLSRAARWLKAQFVGGAFVADGKAARASAGF